MELTPEQREFVDRFEKELTGWAEEELRPRSPEEIAESVATSWRIRLSRLADLFGLDPEQHIGSVKAFPEGDSIQVSYTVSPALAVRLAWFIHPIEEDLHDEH